MSSRDTFTPRGHLRPRVSHSLAATALALLLGVQPVTTDAYLPALPLLTRDLAAPMEAAQMTMAALVIAFGIALLFWGPIADRHGRRPVLLVGLTLYAIASAFCALAPSIDVLLVARIVQGACMASAVVCARAMLRDLYEPTEGARIMAVALSSLGVIALLSPTLGGLAATWFGWRGALGIVAVFGVLLLAFVALRLPETLAQRTTQPMAIKGMIGDWRTIAAHPAFRAWGLLSASTYAGLYVILAATPFVYMRVFDLSATAVGFALAGNSLAYIAGTFICRRLVRNRGLVRAVRFGAVLTLAGGIGTAALALAGIGIAALGNGGTGITALALGGVPPIWALIVPQWFYLAAHGIHQPVAHAAITGPFPQRAGTASALGGLMQSAAAFGTGVWLGSVLSTSIWPLVVGLFVWAACTGFVALWLVPRGAEA